jgi:Fe2+ or Zn2+ uptake regulation protein
MRSREQIDALRAILHQHGLQATSARIGVLQVLREGHEHRTVEDIRTEVLERYPSIDPATVYRTLESLETHGLAVRMDLGDKVTRWTHVANLHHHLVCRRCKTVVEMGNAPFGHLAEELTQTYGVQVDIQHLVLHGLCANCAASSDL